MFFYLDEKFKTNADPLEAIGFSRRWNTQTSWRAPRPRSGDFWKLFSTR
jgi:hypothetical protein